MSADPVRQIAQAVLYEGYLLWPYRRSALKNQQRFTLGGVYPAAFARAGDDRSAIRMECLLEAGDAARVEVALRFLHLVDRRPLLGGEPVDELVVDGERHLAWEEATEREASTPPLRPEEMRAGRTVPVRVPAGDDVEELGDGAALLRSWEPLEGALEVAAVPLRDGLLRLSARFVNRSPWPGLERPAALRRSFLSAHLVARARDAAFVSQTDPPEDLGAAARACRNDGVWPVLVGADGRRDMLLGAPIILSDYPSVAPESPGDLFDGGEIDALLIHSIRALTDAEREEMRATDPRVREILDRSLALTPEQMSKLYGAVREPRDA